MKITKKLLKKIIIEEYSRLLKEMKYDDTQDEEDVKELARYDALNNNKDLMLYRDNPDYRQAYDEIELVINQNKRM